MTKKDSLFSIKEAIAKAIQTELKKEKKSRNYKQQKTLPTPKNVPRKPSSINQVKIILKKSPQFPDQQRVTRVFTSTKLEPGPGPGVGRTGFPQCDEPPSLYSLFD